MDEALRVIATGALCAVIVVVTFGIVCLVAAGLRELYNDVFER